MFASLLHFPPLPLSHLLALSFSLCMCAWRVNVCECVSLYMPRINCKLQNQQMIILLIWINLNESSIWLRRARFPKWNKFLNNQLDINKQYWITTHRTCTANLLWSLLFQRVNRNQFALGIICSCVCVCVCASSLKFIHMQWVRLRDGSRKRMVHECKELIWVCACVKVYLMLW